MRSLAVLYADACFCDAFRFKSLQQWSAEFLKMWSVFSRSTNVLSREHLCARSQERSAHADLELVNSLDSILRPFEIFPDLFCGFDAL